MSTAHLLEVNNLKLSYGGIAAVKGIDFYIVLRRSLCP